MHILLVNTRHYFGGGDSTYTFHLADLLRSHGHAVSFFAMQGPDNLPDANADLFVSHIDYRALNRRKSALSALKVLVRSVYSTEARARFSRLLDRVKPDLVHLQNIHAHITPSVIFEARRQGIPVVWTLHDYKLICPNSHFLVDQSNTICEACRGGRFWQAARQRCKKGSFLASSMASLEAYAHRAMHIGDHVDAFLCPSTFLRIKLHENGFQPLKTHHVPLFLPQDNFRQSPEDDGYLLFLGKLEPLKGIYPLIEAARLAPQVRVVLAGRAEEPLASHLAGMLPANVTYAGFQSGEALNQLKRRARAVVLPSLWYENQPFGILEAFAIGKPVIASDLGGMRELVGDNQRGLLVAMGDVGELVSAMTSLHGNPGRSRALGQSAFQYALETHSPAAHYGRLMDIYRDVLPWTSISAGQEFPILSGSVDSGSDIPGIPVETHP